MLLSYLAASNTVVAMELAMPQRSGSTEQPAFWRKCGYKNQSGGSFLVMVIFSGSGLVIFLKKCWWAASLVAGCVICRSDLEVLPIVSEEPFYPNGIRLPHLLQQKRHALDPIG